MSEPHTTAYAAHRAALLNGAAAPGAPRRAALAAATDTWLAGLHGHKPEGTALVALGGYGRRELSPSSDLDLLLLHDDRRTPAGLTALAERLWYPVWDQGIALDHSVRTLAEAHRAAEENLRVQLGLLDARHLAGDPALTAALRTTALAGWRAAADRRLPELRESARERARRHGELRFLLEPDLKEAHGGLRDATVLRAVAASWLTDAPRAGLAEARTALLDVRDALHLATGRSTDRLALQDQDQVAGALGLPDADALLRRVYEAARTIGYAAEVTWRDVTRILRARSARPRRRPALHRSAGRSDPLLVPAPAPGAAHGDGRRVPLAEGVVAFDGEVSLARTARPERDPVLPLRAAAAAARAGLPLNPAALRRLARTAAPLPVPWPAEARRELCALLGAGRSAVGVWEAMDAAGLVTPLLPEWEHLRCRPQRNPVHRWTVDRHLVETAVRAAATTGRVRRPDLLLVAALLHDIGKGRNRDHSLVGEAVARDVAARMGFAEADVAVLGLLVRHHLLLVETATRRDLDDPATVRAVADAVGRRGTLELLHALTEADARATGTAAWSTWRADLVSALVARVDALLAGEPVEEPEAARPDARTADLVEEAGRTGGPALALYPEPHAARLLVALPDRPGALPAVAGVIALHRLTVHTADLRLMPAPTAARLPAEGPSGDLPAGVRSADRERGPGAGRSTAEGSSPEQRHGAGGTDEGAAGSLCRERTASRRCDAGSPAATVPLPGDTGAPAPARTATAAGAPSGEALVLDWRVAAEYGALPAAARLRADLVRALEGGLDLDARLAAREAAYRGPHGGVRPAPPRVTVAPTGSRRATVLEVRAPDAPGLLYRVSRALERARLRVRSAHVDTLGADAADAFYVTDVHGRPLPPGTAAAVARSVQRALSAKAAGRRSDQGS